MRLLQVGISFGKIILGTIRPSVELQGRLPGTDTFCDITQFPVATEIPGILIIKVNNASLYFANANFIRGRYIFKILKRKMKTKSE